MVFLSMIALYQKIDQPRILIIEVSCLETPMTFNEGIDLYNNHMFFL